MVDEPDPVVAFLRERLGLRPGEPVELMNSHRRALRALTELRPALDRLEAALVDQARLAGNTWDDIGRDLKVSRPTAHRRHAAHDPIAERRRRRAAAWERQRGGPWPT